MNLLSSWCWNWADFIITIVGSLLGFLFAILATIGANKLIRSAQRKSIKKEIISELNNEKSEENKLKIINLIKDGKCKDHKVLELPHIERLIYTNEMQLVSNLSWYNDIMNLHSRLLGINKWFAIKSDYYFNNIIQFIPKNGSVPDNNENKIYQSLGEAIAEEVEKKYFDYILEILKKMQEGN